VTAVLLDTNAFLWWIDESSRLSGRARRAISDPHHDCFVSLVSIWEMAIKCRLGKLKLPKPVAAFVPEHLNANRFRQLDIGFRDVARVEALPDHHRDPFDRLLIAQALERGLAVVTSDEVFGDYGVRRVW